MGEENFGVADLHPEDKDTPLNKKKAGDPAQVARYFVFYLVI
jgi:hypothetical protein